MLTAADINWPILLVGVLLLTVGRKLFWIAVGAVGFIFGMEMAGAYFDGGSDATHLILAVLGGLAGVLIAVFFKKVAVALAGFFLAAAATFWLIEQQWPDVGGWIWVASPVTGIVGAVLAGFLFDAALIVISSLVGASLTVRAVPWGDVPQGVALLVLAAAGVLLQLLMWNRANRPDPRLIRG